MKKLWGAFDGHYLANDLVRTLFWKNLLAAQAVSMAEGSESREES